MKLTSTHHQQVLQPQDRPIQHTQKNGQNPEIDLSPATARGSSYHQSGYLPSRHAPIQQRAIDFYNMTAAVSNHGGDGELIGVDTYA